MSYGKKLEEVKAYINDLEEEVKELKAEGGGAEELQLLQEEFDKFKETAAADAEAAALLAEQNADKIKALKAASKTSDGLSDDKKAEVISELKSAVNNSIAGFKQIKTGLSDPDTDVNDVKASIKGISNEAAQGFKAFLMTIKSL